MKLIKRMIPLLLATALLAGLLSACGSEDDTSASASASQSGATSTEVATPDEIDITTVTDICTYLCGLPSDTVIATADGTPITAGELMYCFVTNCDNMVEYYYYYQGSQELPWDTVIDSGDGESDEAPKSFAEYLMLDSVKSAAMQNIVEDRAAQAGLSLTKEESDAVQATLASVAEQLAADTDKINMQQYLWQQALTEESFIRICSMDYLYQALSNHYYGKGGENEPTDDILLSYLDDSGYYRVKHILLDTKESTDEEKAQKKAKIDDLLAQIKASGNSEAVFDKLMKEHSEDPGLATNPDGYTFQANTNIDPAFEEATLALEPGQLSEVVEGMHGYHIMLRLPMVITDDLKTAFINEQMSLMGTLWIEAAEIELTEAGKNLNAKAIYDAMQSYRYTVAKLMGAV